MKPCSLFWLASASLFPCVCAQADALADSHLTLDIRNFYYDRDYHGDTVSQSRRNEWAQGFILDWRSGWTDGALQFGLDLNATWGVRLDSSTARSGSGLLARDSAGQPEAEYGAAYPTLKLRWGSNEARIGLLSPQLPLLASNTSRLFPERFRGVQWTGQGLGNLTGYALYIDQTRPRDSAGFDDLSLTPQGGSYDSARRGGDLHYLGVDWKARPWLLLSLHGEQIDDLVRRGYFGAKAQGEHWFGELRSFDAKGAGQALAGPVDNRTISVQGGYRVGGHSFALGVQRGWGDTAYAYVNGADTYLFGEQLVSTFGYPQERAWMARYDYDFAAVGVPGLTLNLRYVRGDDIDLQSLTSRAARAAYRRGESGDERERTLDLTYTVQAGSLKNLYIRWRNGHYQSNFADAAEENRLLIGYPLNLW